MNEWIDELSDLCAADKPAVLVTVAGIRGSAPREIGTKMIVTPTETIGTIGGGQLEYQCTRIAVGLFDAGEMSLRSFPLGASMGQCCGGVVEILFEPFANGLPAWLRDLRTLHGQREPAVIATRISQTDATKFVVTADGIFGIQNDAAHTGMVAAARDILNRQCSVERRVQEFYEPIAAPDLNIAVFGAGHVGVAVVATLSSLDCNIRWIDSRRNIFRQVPANVRAIETENPALEVAAMPPGSFYLVMTHSHAIDFEICDRILRRGDASYCGLIGSRSKRRRFEKRFLKLGMPDQQLAELVCPIGLQGISGKKPAEIAVAAAAEILKIYAQSEEAAASDYPDNVYPLSH